MHFPPSDDDNEILAPLEDGLSATLSDGQDPPSMGDNTISGWTEPALRSDRMCWSLISTAYALAYELGLFGSFSDGIQTTADQRQQRSDSRSGGLRAARVKRLLFIYVTQTSGRLGFPSMFLDYFHEHGALDARTDSLQG